jgi:hypothetical protein
MKIQPIVEGQGEVAAFPVLLRRLRDTAQAFTLEVAKPIRRHRPQLVHEASLKDAISLALLTPELGGIVVLFDGDDDCPAQLGPTLRTWAEAAAGPVPCEVVIAHREYETWFLAGMDPPVPQVESIRDAKGRLFEGYIPTVDQASLSATFDMARSHARSRSFRRLVKGFGTLAAAMGSPIASWPPADWPLTQP